MRTVVQRVRSARVEVDGAVAGAIDRGLLLYIGVARGDTQADAVATADKVAGLRIFPGPAAPDGRRRPMDRSVLDAGGACLVVSQFTLAGSVRKGRRPSFDGAMDPEPARPLYEAVARALAARGVPVATGVFGARMIVTSENDGPVTFVLDARDGRIQ